MNMKYEIRVPDEFPLEAICEIEDEIEALQKRIDLDSLARRVAWRYSDRMKRSRSTSGKEEK